MKQACLSSLLWYDASSVRGKSVPTKDKSPALANIVFGSGFWEISGSVKAVQAINKVKVFGHKNPELGGMVLPGHFIYTTHPATAPLSNTNRVMCIMRQPQGS